MNNDFNVNEEVLFKPTIEEVAVNEEVLFKPVTKVSEINEETLFSSGNEELNFAEPIVSTNTGCEVLMVSRSEITEESLSHPTHTYNESGIYSEALFGVKVEDIKVESSRRYQIEGEHIEFSEPVKPNYVDEEVLFTNVEEVDEVDVDNYNNVGGILDSSLLDSILVATEPKKVYEDKNFVQKMLEADPIILERYAMLKNEILKYKGVKSRISNNYDTFNTGRTQLFKMCTSGKSLKLYVNLPFDEVETRLKCKFAGDKKSYEQVPTFLRIKSDRAYRNALYLIGKVVERFELKENKKFIPVDAIEDLKNR